jgi:hypothetical protein
MEHVFDRAQLGVSSGQRRLEAVHPLHAAHPGQHPGGPPQLLRLGLPLQLMRPRLGEPHGAARQPMRGRVHQDLSRCGHRLHARGGVHRVPGDHPLAHRAQADRDFPGHHADPRRQARHPGLGAERRYRGH